MLPTILEHKEQFGSYPQGLTFSLAALIAFYHTDAANDGEDIVAFMKEASVEAVLKKEEYWGHDLSDMLPDVQKWYDKIEAKVKLKFDLINQQFFNRYELIAFCFQVIDDF